MIKSGTTMLGGNQGENNTVQTEGKDRVKGSRIRTELLVSSATKNLSKFRSKCVILVRQF